MATSTTLLEILSSFQTSTESAIQGLPSSELLLPPENGITLFDTKNEIFFSYLQALALRNLNIIRSIKDGSDAEAVQALSDEITKKLIELRVYLERGARPLEQKIKYQVDRVVKAADDEDRDVVQKAKAAAAVNGHVKDSEDEDGESSQEDDSDESDSDTELGADMNGYQPRVSTMMSAGSGNAETTRHSKSNDDGVYRPPRISATAMPTTEQRERKKERPGRSATLDEYVSTELSTAPLAQPSIGSNLVAGGRQSMTARQLKEEAARREYEETHLTRLPAMSKKELLKRGLGRAKDGGFGGEEWRGLGDSLDRIGDLTRRKGKDSALDKSRKRRTVEDGPRGDGIGDSFDIKKRRLEKKSRR